MSALQVLSKQSQPLDSPRLSVSKSRIGARASGRWSSLAFSSTLTAEETPRRRRRCRAASRFCDDDIGIFKYHMEIAACTETHGARGHALQEVMESRAANWKMSSEKFLQKDKEMWGWVVLHCFR